MLSTATSVNAGFWQIVLSFAPPTNPSPHLPDKIHFINPENLIVKFNWGSQRVTFSFVDENTDNHCKYKRLHRLNARYVESTNTSKSNAVQCNVHPNSSVVLIDSSYKTWEGNGLLISHEARPCRSCCPGCRNMVWSWRVSRGTHIKYTSATLIPRHTSFPRVMVHLTSVHWPLGLCKPTTSKYTSTTITLRLRTEHKDWNEWTLCFSFVDENTDNH